MKIKVAEREDIDILCEMNMKLREDERIDNEMSENEIKKRMENFISNTGYAVYLLDEDNQIIGYSVIDLSRRPKYMRQLFIEKEKRNKGYGRKAIDLLLEELEINLIDIEVMWWNENAIRFYEKYGFGKRYIGMRYLKKER